jgi:hypothetical protein
MKMVLIVGLAIGLSGCTMFTRTVYVPEGKAIRLRQSVKNAKIWVKEKDGNIAEGRMNVPEGWFCLPMPSEDK